MDTRILKVGRRGVSPSEVRALGACLREGAVVAFPTETVYGLAVARDSPDAVQRLLEIKERDRDKPLTIHLGDPSDLAGLVAPLSRTARRLTERLWPGPLTLVLPDAEGGFSGFRLPDHPVARDFLRGAGSTVLGTSANLSGEPPLVRGRAVVKAFCGRIDAILDAGETRLKEPSTVVRVDGSDLVVLRRGALSEDEVRRAAGTSVLFVCTGNLCRSPMAEGLLRTRLADAMGIGVGDLAARGFHVISAGTGAILNEPATPAARRAADRLGADLSHHRSRPLTPTLVSGADRIYVAERRHGRVIADWLPDAAGKVRPILPGGEDLPDPYGQTEIDYVRAAERIRDAVAVIADEVVAEEGEGN